MLPFLRVTLAFALVALAAPMLRATTTPDRVDEYQVKAAFLFNFAKFVTWPDGPGGPLVIGIVGEDPFGPIIDAAVRGKAVGGRPLEVRRLGDSVDVSGCHMLYVAGADARRASDILRRAGSGVLTVGESAQFLKEGGLIRFVVEDSRVRFRINTKAVEASTVKIHSQLMSLAAQ